MKKQGNVHFFHFLNDRSGSPRVLSQIIKGLRNKDVVCHLHTSKHDGFLTDIEGIKEHPLPYDYHSSKIVLLLIFIWNQWVIFSRVLFIRNSNSLIYVNTILPVGACIAAYLRAFPVIVHVHETSVRPLLLKNLLLGTAKFFSNQLISVSHFLKEEENLPDSKTKVIYNGLPENFQIQSRSPNTDAEEPFRILMLCSLKDYKGVPEFIELACCFPLQAFELVLNANLDEIKTYTKTRKLPGNLRVWPRQQKVKEFYERADLVLNLSRPDQWVETFGLTAIEAMAYGIPVIVPPVGGIAEVVRNEVDGYHIDSRDTEKLIDKISQLSQKGETYWHLSAAANERARAFELKTLQNQTTEVILELFHNLEFAPENKLLKQNEKP